MVWYTCVLHRYHLALCMFFNCRFAHMQKCTHFYHRQNFEWVVIIHWKYFPGSLPYQKFVRNWRYSLFDDFKIYDFTLGPLVSMCSHSPTSKLVTIPHLWKDGYDNTLLCFLVVLEAHYSTSSCSCNILKCIYSFIWYQR